MTWPEFLDAFVVLHLGRVEGALRVHRDVVDPAEIPRIAPAPAKRIDDFEVVAAQDPGFLVGPVRHLARIIHDVSPQRLYVTKNTKNRLNVHGTDGVHPFEEAFVLRLGFVNLCVFVSLWLMNNPG